MPLAKSVWGVDLGQCALKAIHLRVAGDDVEVVDHFYLEHAKILSQPDVDRQALVDEAMKTFLDRHDLSKEAVVVGVPGLRTLMRFSKLPPVDKKKIPDIVKYEAQQQIPFDMDDVIWDYQTFEQPDAMETEVGIFAMRRELLRDHLSFLSNLNIEPAAVQSGPLALYNALQFDGVCDGETVAILDIGTQNTDLIVAGGGSLWTRNIPIGGNNFTEALLKTFKLSFRKAENLKRSAATSKYARQIFQAMRPVFADLVAEVQRSIGFFTSSRRGVRLNKLIAMGNAFKLPGLQKFLQQNLGMDVVRPTTFKKLSVSDASNAPELLDQLSSFGVAYGLALQGLDKAHVTSNLLPPEIAKQVVWRKKMPWFYAATACLVVSAGIVWGRNLSDVAVVEEARGTQSQPRYDVQYAPEDEGQENPAPDPRAVAVIEKGTGAASPMEAASQVLGAAQHMTEVLSKIQGMNEAAKQEATAIADQHVQKVIWPKILHLIHSALPVGDKELASKLAEGAEAYKALIEAYPEKYERSKRERIFVESFDVQYSKDVLNSIQGVKDASRGGDAKPTGRGVGSTAREAQPPQKGFVVTLTGRTPNGDGPMFVNRTLIKNLVALAKKGDGFYLTGPELVYYERFVPKDGGFGADRGRGLGRSTGGGRSAFGGHGSSGRPARDAGGFSAPPIDPTRDPLTGESMRKDYRFKVVFAVALGEDPSGEQADAESGG